MEGSGGGDEVEIVLGTIALPGETTAVASVA